MKRRILLALVFFVLTCIMYVSCGPRVKIEGPDKPIEINVNVRIDIYNHVAEVEEDIYGDDDDDDEGEDSSESSFLLRSLFMPRAYGASDDAKYKAAKERRKARAGQVKQYKKDGSLGENHKGGVSLIESDKVKKDKAYAGKVKKLVKEENADREIMFKLDAKKRGVSPDIIRQETARYWQDHTKPGQWVEVKKGGKWVWKRK